MAKHGSITTRNRYSKHRKEHKTYKHSWKTYLKKKYFGKGGLNIGLLAITMILGNISKSPVLVRLKSVIHKIGGCSMLNMN